MKKIIEGALYNTETAKQIGYWSNNCSRTDLDFCSEALYRTKSGKYFLFGQGGARSSYSRGDSIAPLGPIAAIEWAEQHLPAREYAAAFGEPEEAASGRDALNISLPRALISKLDGLKSETGKPISRLIEDAITQIYNS